MGRNDTQMDQETVTVTALALIESTPPMQLFAPGALDPILERVRADARAAAAKLDISTEDGRRAIASLAYKVARTKTFMDARREELVAERKREVAAIDCEGRRFRIAMEELKEEVRKPLTDWENAEKKRVHDLAGRVQSIQDIAAIPFLGLATVAHFTTILDELWNHNFQEFTEPATKAHEKARLHLQASETRIKQAEADRIEAERQQAEADEKARLAREAKIAEDARLKAEAEAKRREEANALAAKQREEELARVAAEEKSRLEREKQEAEEKARKAEADRKKAQDDRIAAEKKAEADRVAAAEKVESDRKAALAKAEADRVEAAAQAERDRLAAIEAERKRAEDVRLAAEEEQRKREQDRANRGKVHREILADVAAAGSLGDFTLPEASVTNIVRAIASGKVRHVSITY